MLTNSTSILLNAKINNHAVIAPDFLDLEMARTFVKTAEKFEKPIILSFAQIHKNIISLEEAAAIGKIVSEEVNIPISLHLDHGEDFDFIKKAIELGFTSVMIDASEKPLDENIKITKEIVDLAHKNNISVEAEIGHVGQGENYSGCDFSETIYTDVNDAVRFVKETNVDSLAVSIGTSHGLYNNNIKPTLNFERLHELSNVLDIPLVLHGGSGTGDENLYRCAHEGITKVNLYTDFLLGAMKEVKDKELTDYIALKHNIECGIEKVMMHYIELLCYPKK